MKKLEKPLEKDKDQVKEEPKIKVCHSSLTVFSPQYSVYFLYDDNQLYLQQKQC